MWAGAPSTSPRTAPEKNDGSRGRFDLIYCILEEEEERGRKMFDGVDIGGLIVDSLASLEASICNSVQLFHFINMYLLQRSS